MMISIVLPVYNAEKYIDRCIESVINQSYVDYELLIIDDGSTDSTRDICLKYTYNDERIRYFYQKNKGPSAARNQALKLSKGNYIVFIDSDDYYEKNYLTVLLDLLERNDADIAVCNFYRENFVTKEKYINDTGKQAVIYFNEDSEKIIYDKRIEGYLWNKIFKRSLFDNILFPDDINLCEDLFVLVKIICKNDIKIIYTSSALYNYVMNTDGITDSINYNKYQSYIYSLDNILSIENVSAGMINALNARKYDISFSYIRKRYKCTKFECKNIVKQCRMTLRYKIKCEKNILKKFRIFARDFVFIRWR